MIVRLSDVLAPHLGTCERQDGNGCESGSARRRSRTLAAQGSWFLSFSCLNIWPRVSGWKYSKESLRPWKMVCWRHGKDNLKMWLITQMMRRHCSLWNWCMLICQNWFEDRRGKREDWSDSLAVSTFAWHAAHCLLAQGLTLDGGVLVDLRRAGGLEDDDWWLAIYVMLMRARKLENLTVLGMTDQVEDLLRRGPPAYLRELTDKLETKGAATLERLQNWPLVWLSANFLTSYSAFGFNRLSAERSVGIRDGWTLWRSTDMFDAFCLSYWYVDRWYPDMIWHVWCRDCF